MKEYINVYDKACKKILDSYLTYRYYDEKTDIILDKFLRKTARKVFYALRDKCIKKYFPTGKENIDDSIVDQIINDFYKWEFKTMMKIIPYQYLDSEDIQLYNSLFLQNNQ